VLASETFAILERVLPAERRRLVRLCARIVGDADAAEDLAQETLLEAWRHAHKLQDPAGYAPWLSAIARNVCLRWRHRQGHEAVHVARLRLQHDGDTSELLNAQPDDFDLELELERRELVSLLDRALALLPPDTRAALVERYVEETPLAEAAARLGMSDSGLKARLHRGKLTLRRVLVRDYPDESAAYGILPADANTPQETRIWCSQCGQARLLGIFDRIRGELSLGCPNCTPGQPTGISWMWQPAIFQGVKGYRAALSRQTAWVHDYARRALDGYAVTCVYCGMSATLYRGALAKGLPEHGGRRGIYVVCETCHVPLWSALGSFALSLPEGRRFWRRYPRIHALPEREIEVDGAVAIVKTYQEQGGVASLDVIFRHDTLEVLHIFGAPAPGGE
jgi:RNA polymerase sigma factor (sigma-70 family)